MLHTDFTRTFVLLVFLWIVLRNISLNFNAILQHWQELEITIENCPV